MKALGSRRVVAVAVVALALVAAMAYTLLAGQKRADSLILERYGDRAKLAANFTASVLATSAKQNIDGFRKDLSGSPAEVRRGLLAYTADDPTGASAVLDERGRVMASVPGDGLLETVTQARAERDALDGSVSLSDVFMHAKVPTVDFDIPFYVKGHRRVLVTTVALAQLEQFVSGYLRSAPAVSGAHAYLLDGQGRVIVSTAGDEATKLPADHHVRALQRWTDPVAAGALHYVTRPVRYTQWRIAFSAPSHELFAPVHGSTRSAEWILFGAFVLILMGFVGAGVLTVRRSEQLTVSRSREENALERERTARQLAHERLHDPLTGLPNRALFLDRITHALMGVVRRGRPLMVMFIDLDRFKRVNDSLGHSHGDQVVREVARRLGGALRPSDTVGRFGGDEFLVLCESITDEREAIRIAKRVAEAIEAPMRVGERELHVTACIGIALQSPSDAPVDAGSLIRDADAAMYRAKEQGAASVKVFDPEVHKIAVERLEMEIALREAIARNEMVIHYQPIVSLEDWSLKGVEALVRWNRPGVGLVPPLEFIPLAEDTGMIVPLGAWVLKRAIADLLEWRAQGWAPDDLTLTVNLSPRQLADDRFADRVREMLVSSGIPPGSLCLEITESVVMDDLDRSVAVLHQLKRLGVRLALDDFGVGQSSLAHVARLLPIDIVKVDRSFVRGANLARDRAVLDAIAVLTKSLALTAIAEGIENAGQASTLQRLGYPLGQGFLFSRPGPAEQLRAYVERTDQRKWPVPTAGNGAHNGDGTSAGVVVDQPS